VWKLDIEHVIKHVQQGANLNETCLWTNLKVVTFQRDSH